MIRNISQLIFFFFPVKYSIHYDGSVVMEEKEATFTLGESDDPYITNGLEMAIKKMKQNERSKLHMQPSYAFGQEGNKELGVPSNACVTFETELVSFDKVSTEI